jgi:hypothetical protein
MLDLHVSHRTNHNNTAETPAIASNVFSLTTERPSANQQARKIAARSAALMRTSDLVVSGKTFVMSRVVPGPEHSLALTVDQPTAYCGFQLRGSVIDGQGGGETPSDMLNSDLEVVWSVNALVSPFTVGLQLGMTMNVSFTAMNSAS